MLENILWRDREKERSRERVRERESWLHEDFEVWKSNLEYGITSKGMEGWRYVGKDLRREGGGLRWLEIWFDPVRCQLVRNRFRPNPTTTNFILDT